MENSIIKNLNSSEKAFFQLHKVKRVVNLDKIGQLKQDIENRQTSLFESSVEMSKIVNKAYKWFKTAESKEARKEHGIELTLAEFGQKGFGYSRSQFNKLKTMGENIEDSSKNWKKEYNDRVKSEREAGENPQLSIEGFNSFVRSEKATGGASPLAQTRSTSNTKNVFTCTAQANFIEGLTRNFAIRITPSGEVKTSNTQQELQKVVKFIKEAMKSEAQRIAQAELTATESE